MGNNNALEMFRYTFPDLIVVGGSSNGKPEVAVETVFLNAYRMNELLHDADKDKTQASGLAGKNYDFLRPGPAGSRPSGRSSTPSFSAPLHGHGRGPRRRRRHVRLMLARR